jgi:phage tail sheath protein FI
MSLTYLHGIQVLEATDGVRSITTVASSIIGLIGTAPDAIGDTWPLNTPILLPGDPTLAEQLGGAGTLYDAIEQMFEITNPTVVVVRVTEGQTLAQTWSNIIGDPITQTGIYAFLNAQQLLGVKPRLICAPGFTGVRPSSGLVGGSVTNGGAGYTQASYPVAIGGDGGASGAVVNAVVVGGSVSAIEIVDAGFGCDSGTTFTIPAPDAPLITKVNATATPVTGVVSGTVGNIGAGYVEEYYPVTITGTGQGATAHATFSNGSLTAIVIDTAGTGYDSTTTFTLPAPDATSGTKTQATATPVIGIVSCTVTNAGSGYVNPSYALTFTGVTSAVAYANVENGSVTSISVTSAGHGASLSTTCTIPNADATQPTKTQATAVPVIGYAKNPVAGAIETILPRLRACAIIDGPNTTDEDAVAFRNDFDNARIKIVDPYPLVWDTGTSTYVSYPPSPLAVAQQSYMDNNYGCWWEFSNQEIPTIGGTSRAIGFSLTDPDSEANYLNENDICTIVKNDGYRFWGDRTTSSDPQWVFWSVRRTMDIIEDSVAAGLAWAMDRPFSQQLLVDLVETVNSYLSLLTALGATLGGVASIDPTVNAPTQLADGILRIDFDAEPPAPLEQLKLTAHRNSGYYTIMLNDVLQTLAATANATVQS